MKLIINGQEQDLIVKNASDIVSQLGYQGKYFAVAINNTHIPLGQLNETHLSSGDKIEILMPMQGG